MESFSFSPPRYLVEEGKWLFGVNYFECTNSAFRITDEKNLFGSTTPRHWKTQSAEKTIDELDKLIEPTSQNGIELHVKQFRKKMYNFNE